MNGDATVLLATFIVVIVVQVINRTAGAIAAIVWSIGFFGYGAFFLQQGGQLAFLRVPVRLWHFATFMTIMLSYNVWVLYRLLKTRR